MPDAAALNVGFGTPWQAQIDFLRAKLGLSTERWDEIQRSAHDRAFVVAGAGKADLLADLQASLVQAAADGKGLDAWRTDFKAIVAQHGWTGWTGEGSAAGEAWRTKVIYQTNMATSYAAGRYRQLTDPEYLRLRPFWRYIHSDNVLHPRPLHLSWHGLTLPHDHPFWKTHFPPCGWGCQCRVTSVSAKEGQDSARAGLGEPPKDWDHVDPRTGAQVGIDKGFDYTPGATWHPDLEKYPFEVARAVVADNMRDGIFDRWLGKLDKAVTAALENPERAGMSKADRIKAVRTEVPRGEQYPVAVLGPEWRDLLGSKVQTVMLSDYDAVKQEVSREGDPNFTVDEYRDVQHLFDDVDLIVRDAKQATVWFRDTDNNTRVAVLWQTLTGKGLFLKSLRLGSLKELAKQAAGKNVIFQRS